MPRNFSVDLLAAATGRFSLNARLPGSDQGAQSVVYRGQLRVGHGDGDGDVAIKELSSDRTPRADQILNELAALSRVSHVNLLKVFGWAFQPGPQPRAFLVYPFISGGTLTRQLSVERPDAGRWRLHVAVGVARKSIISNSSFAHLRFRHDINHVVATVSGDERSKQR